MKLLLVAVVLFGVLCLSTSFQFIEKVEATVRLGDNGEVNVTSVKKRTFSLYLYIFNTGAPFLGNFLLE
jgi:hypothetical protein